MKTLRRLFGASVLTITFALLVSAGEMSTPLAPPQPAPTSATMEGQIEIGRNGGIHTGNSDEATAGDAVVAGALGLLQGVLSLL
jgi:hypothetical protein